MNGQKRIAILSDAGSRVCGVCCGRSLLVRTNTSAPCIWYFLFAASTGISLHADLRAQNQRRRVHITLTAAGRRMKQRAQKIPGCVMEVRPIGQSRQNIVLRHEADPRLRCTAFPNIA